MTSIPHILGSDSLTVFFKGNSYTINKQAHTYGLVLDAIKKNDSVALDNALNIRQGITDALTKRAKGKVSIQGNQIFYGDREVSGLIASRIFEILRAGLEVTPMVNFLENLMQNPSKRAVDELFGFLDACKLPITPDGHFLAYKRVRSDYKDCHSGTMDNSVGKALEMERNLVDEDKNNTCSYGLHFCSYNYLSSFGGDRIMVLKINPADVVAIPADYNNSKGRTCRYEVVDELPLDQYKMPEVKIQDGYEDRYYEEDEEEYDDLDEYCNKTYPEENLDILDTEVKPVYNSSAKLSEHDVRRIREEFSAYLDYSIADICNDYNISRRQAKRIISGEAWKWVK